MNIAWFEQRSGWYGPVDEEMQPAAKEWKAAIILCKKKTSASTCLLSSFISLKLIINPTQFILSNTETHG